MAVPCSEDGATFRSKPFFDVNSSPKMAAGRATGCLRSPDPAAWGTEVPAKVIGHAPF